MRHFRRPRGGRARGDSAEALFERALRGDDRAGRGRFDPRRDRKTLQLCRQVQRALAMALPGECAEEALRDSYVEAVEPMGSAGQLLVRLVLPWATPRDTGESVAGLMAKLAAYTPRLRAAVAGQICRKRVPNLAFVLVPPDGASDAREGGGRGE